MVNLTQTYRLAVARLQVGLGLDIDYFLRSGFYATVQQAAGLLSGLVLAYIFGHFTSKAMFGEYNLILSLVGLFSIVSLPGLSIALLRSVGEGFDSSLPIAVRKRLLWSMLGLPLFIGAAYYYQWKGSDVMLSLLLIAGAFSPLVNSLQTTLSFFIARKRFDLHALFSVVSSILTVILVGVAVVVTHNLAIILVGYFLGIILPSLASFKRALSLMRKPEKHDADLLSYGYFLTGLQILPIMAANLNSILLAGFLGVEKLAIFSVISKFPGLVQRNFDVFYKPVMAKLAEQTAAQQRAALRKHVIKFIALGVIFFVGLWLLTPILINVFYGAQYTEAIAHARLYTLWVLPMPLTWALTDVITFQKHKRAIFVMGTIFPILKLMSYVWVIPLWQLTGLIWINIIDRMVTMLYSGVVIFRSYDK